MAAVAKRPEPELFPAFHAWYGGLESSAQTYNYGDGFDDVEEATHGFVYDFFRAAAMYMCVSVYEIGSWQPGPKRRADHGHM